MNLDLLKDWANDCPEEIDTVLEQCDFTGTELFLCYLFAARRATEDERAKAFWRAATEYMERVADTVDLMVERDNECPHCHGSGGGYMGGMEPRCPYCRGRGRLAA